MMHAGVNVVSIKSPTAQQMYFVMFWYVTEICRNVFIRLC